jgi:hypothetical protein
MLKNRFIHTLCLLIGILFISGPTNINAQKTMSRLIQVGNEIIRVNPEKPNQIQYSTSGGRIWSSRYTGTSCGDFIDLIVYKNEIIAATTKGIYYSTSGGRIWSSRYTGTSCGKFLSLMDNGKELLAQTDKGLYYSTSNGRIWSKRQ